MNENIYDIKFPDELYGVVVDGIDLTQLSLDSLRLIEAYVKQEGELSDIQKQILRQCETELKHVLLRLEGHPQKYFQKVHEGVKMVLKKYKK